VSRASEILFTDRSNIMIPKVLVHYDSGHLLHIVFEHAIIVDILGFVVASTHEICLDWRLRRDVSMSTFSGLLSQFASTDENSFATLDEIILKYQGTSSERIEQ
jgi:hypothetical protein